MMMSLPCASRHDLALSVPREMLEREADSLGELVQRRWWSGRRNGGSVCGICALGLGAAHDYGGEARGGAVQLYQR